MNLATAREAWAACAPLLAGAARVRIGVRTARGVLEYRTRDERPLTAVRPAAPAAVRVYGADGCCTALCLDLDIGRGGPGAVAADADRLTAWLGARGARVVTDHSPTGGRHVYVPFAERVPYETAREVVEALASSYPTLDAGPHRSLRTGCIRPPGATHKGGGHQELAMPLAGAYDVLRRPNSPAVLEAIRTHLHTEITAWRLTQNPPEEPAPSEDRPAQRPGRVLGARLRVIAQSGNYDRGRYPSASEARQSVIAGAVAAGWVLADVAVRLADGRWPGLAGMYARYSPTHRRTALAKDWHSAQTYLNTAREEQAHIGGQGHVRISHTSPSQSQRGALLPGEPQAEHDHIRTWRTLLRAVELHRFPGRSGQLTRFLLRALGEAAHKSSSRYVAFGTRSLAVATGVDHSTVAAVLRRLAAEPGGWVDLVEQARGERADLYELTIPADLADMAADLRWDKGRAYALRPAFRELGHVAAFVFEAVENDRATTITTLVPATGLSRSAVAAAADTLLAHGLLERSPVGLVAHPERLRAVAELVGAMDAVTAQLRRYARDRQLWHAHLARHEPDHHSPTGPDDPLEDYWWPPEDDDPAHTLTEYVAA